MDAISSWLLADGVPAMAIHREDFVASPAAASCSGDATYRLGVPDFGKELTISASQSLLDVLEAAGLPIIGACRTGVCGSCRCRIVSGEVSSSQTGPLSQEDIAAAYVLACSSRARSDVQIALR